MTRFLCALKRAPRAFIVFFIVMGMHIIGDFAPPPANAQPGLDRIAIHSRTILAFTPKNQEITLDVASRRGLNPRIIGLLRRVERHFGKKVTITSGCRSRKYNRRIGGAKRSMHLQCKAADIRISGVNRGRLVRYARKLPNIGGIGTYCNQSIVHLDIGPRRNWHHCRRRR